MEVDRIVKPMVKLYELHLLYFSLCDSPTLSYPTTNQSEEKYLSHINTVVEPIDKEEYAEALHSQAACFVLNGACDNKFVSESG